MSITNKIVCEICESSGAIYKCSKLGPGWTTSAYRYPFADEEGRFHQHDLNLTTEKWKCSNGHIFIRKWMKQCWCGWPDDSSNN